MDPFSCQNFNYDFSLFGIMNVVENSVLIIYKRIS